MTGQLSFSSGVMGQIKENISEANQTCLIFSFHAKQALLGLSCLPLDLETHLRLESLSQSLHFL